MSSTTSLPLWALCATIVAPAIAQDTNTPPAPPQTAATPVPLATRGSGGGIQAATSNPGRTFTIYTNLATSPTSLVPGLSPARFTASTSSTAIFDRPWGSPSGNHWVLTADTDISPTTEDEVLLLDGAVAGREGTPAPWEPGQNWGTLDARIGVNDNGDFAFTTNVAPSTVNDDYAVVVTGGGTIYTVYAREADPITALPGATWDDTIDSPVLLNDGRLSVSADGIDGAGVVTTTDDEVLTLGTTILAREGITVPTGQAGGATNAWENFDFEDTWFDANGANHIILGDLLGATTSDQVVVVNGAVVLQEGTIIPGSGFANPINTTGVAWVTMDGVGNWMARGDNVGGQDWIVRNGAVVATTGDALGSGAVSYFAGPMDGTQEVPPTGSPATGSIRILIDTTANQLHYEITYTGLTGVETAAHIHGFAPAGANAGVLYALPLGASKIGTITYADAEESGLLSGLAYVNVHTDLFPSGELRGQILASVERWDGPTATPETFYAVAGNGSNWVAMGTTNGPVNRNGVVVLNGQHVILRENDPLDIDGNGLYDDGAFLRTFGNDDFVVTDDGTVYFTATIQDAAGVQTGQGFFRREGGNLQRAFCFGDGSGTACPCANESVAGTMAGCLNSLGLGGRLDAGGIASISADTLVLQGSDMPNSSALYFQGTSESGGGLGTVFGDGLRCAGGTIIRLGTKTNVGGVSQYPVGGDLSVSVRGLVAAPGSRTYQVWYRNAAAFCTASTFNLTNGIAVTWGA